MKKDTVGKLALALQQKGPETRDSIELERSMHENYEQNVIGCIERGKKDFTGDFFVVVITKKERLLNNVMRNYFFPRKSCPTPDYDQTVYRYLANDDVVEFLWTIPSQDTCYLLKDNALAVVKEEKELLQYVLDFADGTLFKLAKQLNGEQADSILLQ